MSRRRNDQKVGAGVLIRLALFVAVSALLTTVVVASVLDVNVKASHTYSALFGDTGGLQQGDTVRIAGVEVGKVASVALLQGRAAAACRTAPNCARVDFSVDAADHVTASTTPAIFFANLLGQRTLELLPGAAGAPTLRNGSTIPLSQSQEGLDLTAVFNGFQPLFTALSPDQVNKLTASVIEIFQGQGGTVADLVQQVASVTSNLADREQVINQLLQNLAGLVQTVGGQGTQLGQLVDNFDSLVSGVAGERSQLDSSIVGLNALTNAVAGELSASQPALNQSIAGLSSVAHTLAVNQTSLDAVVNGLPGVAAAADKFIISGNYLNIYLCNLTINAVDEQDPSKPAQLNISLNPNLPAPQAPVGLLLPSGPVGSSTQHTAVCG